MVLGFDYLRALRECCRDEAAFERLRVLLNLASELEGTPPESQPVEERYRAMLDAIPDLMFRLDRQGYYLDSEGKQVVTVPREEIVGKHVADLLPPDVAEVCLAAIRQTLETG